jgi:hypothetical protein
LWFRRKESGVRRMYSRSSSIASFFVISVIVAGFHGNAFAWWNTKWIMLYEIEALDESGNTYLVDHADLSPPYAIFDLYKPAGRNAHTNVYGMTVAQRLMQMFEEGDPVDLQRFRALGGQQDGGSEDRVRKGAFRGFMRVYFQNRNRAPGRTVPPFLLGAPSLHNRRLSAANLYRDQAPVVEVRLRFIEIYYTGSELQRMRDEIVYSVRIPPFASGDSIPSIQ